MVIAPARTGSDSKRRIAVTSTAHGNKGIRSLSRLLSRCQPWVEFLDASSVLSPVFDIIGVFVTLNLGVSLELKNIVCDSLQLILECLGISWNLVTLWQKILLSLGIGLEDLKLGSNVFLEVHCPSNSVFWEHGPC